MSGVAFGLDLSGYSTGKTVLAKATQCSTEIRVDLYRADVLNPKLKVGTRLSVVSSAEAKLIGDCIQKGPIAIDAPIDLQGLPSPDSAGFPWELTRRHVDKAFGALPPLADKIGAVTARISNILANISKDVVDRTYPVYETYPAASLQLLHVPSKGYKDKKASIREGRWVDVNGEGDTPITNILTKLNFHSDDELDDDDIDAALCAVTALYSDNPSHVVSNADLRRKVVERMKQKCPELKQEDVRIPANYLLLSAGERLPKICVHRCSGTPI